LFTLAQLKETIAIVTVSLFICAVANSKRGTVDERPHWEEAQEELHRQSGRVKDETLTLKG